MSIRRKILLSALVASAALACAVAVAGVFLARAIERELANDEANTREAYAERLALFASYSNLQFDPRDERGLMRNSEEVFVGRVARLTARADNDPVPFLEGWTPTARFDVEVEEVRKDDSPGDGLRVGETVTVNQISVPPPGTEATVCFGNGFPDGGYVAAQRIRQGMRYVFATEYHRQDGWHDMRVAPFGWMVLSGDAQPDGAPEAGDGRPSCDQAAEMRRGK